MRKQGLTKQERKQHKEFRKNRKGRKTIWVAA